MPRALFAAVAVVLLALAACAVSGSLHGVCAEGECTELLLPGRINTNRHDCLDTLDSGWPMTTQTLLPNSPECKWSDTCNDVRCENCNGNVGHDLWPHLNITLEHYDEKKFGIVISWDKPDHVTGYVLTVRREEKSGNCGGGNLAKLGLECGCINITNPNTTNHTHVANYLDDTVPKIDEKLYIKLIPTPWCDGPSIDLLIPQTCHNIRPGDCETCGLQLPDKISPPTNVNLTHLPHLREVLLTWEPGESYYGLPYPNISFFFKVTNVKDDSETTPWLEVIGRTNLTLQNLTLNVNYSVEVQAADCGCSYERPVYYFYLNESTPLPSSITESNLATTVPQPTTTTISISQTSTNISISQPIPQTPATNHIEHLPVILSTLLTGIVGLTVAVIIITAVAILSYRKYCGRKLGSVGGLVAPSDINDYQSVQLMSSKSTRGRVLLIFSLETPRSQQEVILQLLGRDLTSTLQNYSMEKDRENVHPEVVWYDRSKLGRREGMAQWVEREVKACDKVLCVCNEEFKREWDGEIEPFEGSLVSCIKNLYLGSLNEAAKYVIVLMQVSHGDYIPNYFKMCRQFLCEKSSVKDIAHCVLNTPLHTHHLYKSYQL